MASSSSTVSIHKEPQKATTQSASATVIGWNEDLLTEILIHLPAKPLFRFKKVSKQWLSLISDHRFCLLWKHKHLSSPSGIFLRRYGGDVSRKYEYVRLDVPFDSESPTFVSLPSDINEIKQSCNGLFLCSSSSVHHCYCIYNPTTGQLAALPRQNLADKNLIAMNLAFDPSRSPNYKIVAVYHNGRLDSDLLQIEIEIYSSETSSWKLTTEIPFRGLTLQEVEFRFGVFHNGAIHWPSASSKTSLYFDVDNECCRSMPMPPIQGRWPWKTLRYFGESRGHLHLVEFYDLYQSQCKFDVLEMERDYSDWFVKYHVDLSVPLPIKRFSIISLVRGSIEDDSYLVLYVPGKGAISYHFENKSLKKLSDLSVICWDVQPLELNKWVTFHQFIENPSQF